MTGLAFRGPLDALARDGRVADLGLSPAVRSWLRAAGARLFSGPGPTWWAVGERRRLQLHAALFEAEPVAPRPDPDAAAFDGPGAAP